MAVAGSFNIPDNIMYSMEIIRLGSFATWPDHGYRTISPRKLAKAGLFYTGERDKVTCFSCGGSLEDWGDYYDEPLNKHFQEYPECVFARQKMEEGKGAVGGSGMDWESRQASDRIETAMGRMKTLGCDTSCPRDLNTEVHRLHTFYDWPRDVPVNPEHLARLGFFYLGTGDAVECAFCGGVLHRWEEVDDPAEEHANHYPRCPFVRGNPTSNMPTEGERYNLGREPQKSSLPIQVASPHPATYTYGPKHPELASQELRLTTFFSWPSRYTSSPTRLAEAGFYYTNIDDGVKCFWCDGVLKDWRPGEDPWTEHARWYAEKCGFVLRERGIDYVMGTKKKCSPELVGDAHQPEDDETSPKHFRGRAFGKRSQYRGDERRPTSDSEGRNNDDDEVEDMQCSMEALQTKLQRLTEERQCKVCRLSDACTVFLPCGHMCCCEGCASVLQRRRGKCPYCKERFSRVKRASLV
ncbi:PREDICTED: baculoviral IAP repeat-containing protein 7-B-like [Branchiostoma belcheri]|uniref:Baculoviral IAP repeat-containing protein 7-B-like n=1 Tax=Branchiostoma belcheri TaxID=7741 RepID=A0A6P5ADT9_BRABE|nr:PREDICTED: baculoviral IAP repeat-containing protein 7-B-like [Branchiostoma belcheri]